jgi:hypothetical protein
LPLVTEGLGLLREGPAAPQRAAESRSGRRPGPPLVTTQTTVPLRYRLLVVGGNETGLVSGWLV